LSEMYNNILSIHPNPTFDMFTIIGINEVSGFKYIEIVSTTLEIVFKAETIKEKLNVSELPPGVYFLNISHDNGTERIRFVKQ